MGSQWSSLKTAVICWKLVICDTNLTLSRPILYIRYCNLRDWYLGRPYNNALQQSSFYLSNAWTTTATDPLVTYFVIVDKLPRWWNHDLQMFDTCIKRHVLIKDNTKSPRSHQQHIRIERMEKDNTLTRWAWPLPCHGLASIRSDPSNWSTGENAVLKPVLGSFHTWRSECKV